MPPAPTFRLIGKCRFAKLMSAQKKVDSRSSKTVVFEARERTVDNAFQNVLERTVDSTLTSFDFLIPDAQTLLSIWNCDFELRERRFARHGRRSLSDSFRVTQDVRGATVFVSRKTFVGRRFVSRVTFGNRSFPTNTHRRQVHTPEARRASENSSQRRDQLCFRFPKNRAPV